MTNTTDAHEQRSAAPSRESWVYSVACGFVLVILALAWLTYPSLLYIGRDGRLAEWLALAQSRWSGAFEFTALNPFQGMGSMFLPVNTWWIPGTWPLFLKVSDVARHVLSMVTYLLEFTLSAVVLFRVLGLSMHYSYVACVWLALFSFPPFNFLFGLQGWITSAPHYGHSLALGNLMLALLWRLGQSGGDRSEIGTRVRDLAILAGVFSLYVTSVPAWNGGLLLGYMVLIALMCCSSPTPRSLLGRSLGVAMLVILAIGLDLPTFYTVFKGMSARFSGEEPRLWALLTPRWQVSLTLSTFEDARRTLCAWGVVCERLSGFPGSLIGSEPWLALTVVGSVLWGVRERGPFARLARAFALVWSILLVYWALLSIGFLPGGPFAPLYVYLPFYPLLALFSLYPLWWIGQRAWRSGLRRALSSRTRQHPGASVPVRGSTCLAAVPVMLTAGLAMWLGVGETLRAALVEGWQLTGQRLATHSSPPPRSAIIEILEREVSLKPGSVFRGNVVTVLGEPGGGLRAAGGATQLPKDLAAFEHHLDALQSIYGNAHALLDLWRFWIPTLEEYGQAISLPLRWYAREFLTRPDEPVEAHFLLVKTTNIEVLRALGVRFVITDSHLGGSQVRLRHRLSAARGIDLNLYELLEPNLGNFSPTRLVVIRGVAELRSAITRNPRQLETVAYLETEQGIGPLVRANNGRIHFLRQGVRVVAESSGRSTILLPLQFSHCLVLERPEAARDVRLVRANALHTLVVFEGALDIVLRWRMGPWRGFDCRMKDLTELRGLGL